VSCPHWRTAHLTGARAAALFHAFVKLLRQKRQENSQHNCCDDCQEDFVAHVIPLRPGSTWFIGEYNTWRAIEYLVTGRAVGSSVQMRADYAVGRGQVLRFYTANAAWRTFRGGEGNSGSREPPTWRCSTSRF
jgi:hypothetical protein